MAVLDGDDAVMVAYATPRRLYGEGGSVGLRMPAYCTAVGRVLIAGLPAEQRESYLRRVQPVAVTSHTVTDKSALRRIITEVEQDGYAFADEEAELGFRALAVPIVHPTGPARYALNVGCLTRTSPEDMQRFLPVLKEAGRQLQSQLI
jgi:IclR family transcriptional regulator, pca regulon regulatory protein